MKNKEYTISCENDGNIKIIFVVDFIDGLTIKGTYKKKFDESVLLYSEFIEDYNQILDEEWFVEKLDFVYNQIIDRRDKLIKINNFFENFKTFKFVESK